MTQPDPIAPPRRAATAFIFVTVLLDMLAIGLVIPVLPRLIVEFLGGDTPRAAEIFGLFGTAWAFMHFIFSPVLGALSDRFGRLPVIHLSNLGLGLDYVIMALAPTLGWLLVGRILSGITAASVSTSFAYIADVTPAERRAAAFGMIGAAFGVGFVLGPALGGILGGIDPFRCRHRRRAVGGAIVDHDPVEAGTGGQLPEHGRQGLLLVEGGD